MSVAASCMPPCRKVACSPADRPSIGTDTPIDSEVSATNRRVVHIGRWSAVVFSEGGSKGLRAFSESHTGEFASGRSDTSLKL